VQTNDVVKLLDTVNFQLLGRADNVINSGGVKVQPEQIEQVISTVLNERGLSWRVLVVGLPDERLGQRIVVFCEEWTMNKEQLALIQNAVWERIGPYAVPKEAVTVAHFIQTPTGKIDRARTIDLYR